MLKNEFKILRADISDLLKQNKEEKLFFLNDFINAYFLSLVNFGFNDKVTKDTVNIIKELNDIFNYEKEIFDFLYSHYKTINYEECCEFLDLLDEVNVKTYYYYSKLFNDIIVACQTKCRYRATRSNKDFDTLIESDKYEKIALGLSISYEDIKECLNYEDDFWHFIDNKIEFYDAHIVKNNKFVNKIYDSSNILVNIELCLPLVVNYNTAIINYNALKEAYSLYKNYLFKSKVLSYK